MAELGDLKKHVDEAENLFRKTEEQHKHCRERLIALIAAVESQLRDNRNEIERNRAEYGGLTQSAEELGEMLRKLQVALANNAPELPATRRNAAEYTAEISPTPVPRTAERAGEKAATQAYTADDPEKVRRGLRRALSKARASKISTAPVAAPPTEADG